MQTYRIKQKLHERSLLLDKIKVIDARMGRGKTTAAINYMEETKGTKRFLFVTPFLTEVDRICHSCDFEQPDGDQNSKLCALKALMHKGENVASTHSLFYLMDDEALDIARQNHYSLIIDESVNVIQRVSISPDDLAVILEQLTTEDEQGFLHWIDKEYSGVFSKYKKMADTGSLYKLNNTLTSIMRPSLLTSFDEVIMMTYLFKGQYQKAYLDFFGFEYEICGIETDGGCHFSDKPDNPPPLDYRHLIHIIDDPKLNEIGRSKHALSKTWYTNRGRNNPDIKKLRNNLNVFFRKRVQSASDDRMWTCFKSHAHKLYGDKNRYVNNFLQLGARATNDYKNRRCIAYMVNRFIDPNIIMFFGARDVKIDDDDFALSEMLQWIWRSCIRDDQPIDLYIPSSRMRKLLQDWIENTYKGADCHE